MNYQAFLFDLNGTMINDMPYHVKAWHHIVTGLGADISLEQMKEECYGKNHEMLERVFPGRFSEAEKNQLGTEKEEQYRQDFKPHLQLLPGLEKLLDDSLRTGIKLGIGSAAITLNIDFVLDNLSIRTYFDALVSADDVHFSKPHPETYLMCARQLGVIPAKCLVFEDAPKGVEAALNAGMNAVVVTLMHEQNEFSHYPNIIGFIKDYNDPLLANLF